MDAVFLRCRHYITCILHACLIINSRTILSRREHMAVGIRNLNTAPAAAPPLCQPLRYKCPCWQPPRICVKSCKTEALKSPAQC